MSSLVLSLITIHLLWVKREGRGPSTVVLLVLHVWVSLGTIVAAVLIVILTPMTVLRLTHSILSVLGLLDGLRLVDLVDLSATLDLELKKLHSFGVLSSILSSSWLCLLLVVLLAPALALPLLVSSTCIRSKLLLSLLLELLELLLHHLVVLLGELGELVHLCLMLLASRLQLCLLLLELPLSNLDSTNTKQKY